MAKKRIFKTKAFSKWFNKSDLSDTDLLEAVKEIEKGLYEADLGGNVYKKRVAIGVIGGRVAAPERSLQPSSVNIGFLFLPLQKTNELISTMLNLRIYKRLLKYCLDYQAMKLTS